MNAAENVIDEIRESRSRMSEQCGHDLAKYLEYLKTFNSKYSTQVAGYLKQQPTERVESARVN